MAFNKHIIFLSMKTEECLSHSIAQFSAKISGYLTQEGKILGSLEHASVRYSLGFTKHLSVQQVETDAS